MGVLHAFLLLVHLACNVSQRALLLILYKLLAMHYEMVAPNAIENVCFA